MSVDKFVLHSNYKPTRPMLLLIIKPLPHHFVVSFVNPSLKMWLNILYPNTRFTPKTVTKCRF